ncbi:MULTISPECIES: ParB/Srx family N-terminal domain-containing protein [unclassified Pseudomonas]|uniref:ParB/Srx family N-terminal domain-containing protein n=1 Tax=unclassified Pseudomonas TaxID=196821 RepID=UPI0025D33451|nr:MULTISPECIES: ParB/Srx family N-terminal domain-containing protein [unclassified Pseudomonas]
MRIPSCSVAVLLALTCSHALAFTGPKAGTVVEVSLEQLHPTQAVIGFDQVYYQLERFARDRQKLFDEICESNGQDKARTISDSADPLKPETFACTDQPNTHPQAMKTVVVGPGGQFYLTDGHHTFSTLWEQPGAGPKMKMKVRITDVFSDSADQANFWMRMQQAHKVWLKDGNGQSISPDQLPAHVGLQSMHNDILRSLVYFVRGAAYGKPKSGDISPEFLEFYWADWLRGQLDLGDYNLSERSGYHRALQAASDLMVKPPSSKVVGGGMTAKQLGGFKSVKHKVLTRTADEKLPLMIDYKDTH